MGVDILLYEVKDQEEEGSIMPLQYRRHLRRKFKSKTFKSKLEGYNNYEKPFRNRGLKHKEWNYDFTDDDNNDHFFHRNDTENKLSINESEFDRGFIEMTCLKIREEGYLSGSGKLYSSWFSLYDIISDDYYSLWNRFMILIYKKDIETFINWFVIPKFRELFREHILSKINENRFMEIDW